MTRYEGCGGVGDGESETNMGVGVVGDVGGGEGRAYGWFHAEVSLEPPSSITGSLTTSHNYRGRVERHYKKISYKLPDYSILYFSIFYYHAKYIIHQ